MGEVQATNVLSHVVVQGGTSSNRSYKKTHNKNQTGSVLHPSRENTETQKTGKKIPFGEGVELDFGATPNQEHRKDENLGGGKG